MGYSLQRPRAHPKGGFYARCEEEFQWATHFNAHAHALIIGFRHFQHLGFNGLLTSTPTRTADEQTIRDCADVLFQWATHFNAHAHASLHRAPGNRSRLVSMGYSLQRPRAPPLAPAARPRRPKVGFNGLLTSTPTRTKQDTHECVVPNQVSMGYSLQRPRARCWSDSCNRGLCQCRFQWATHFNAHAHAPVESKSKVITATVSFNGLLTSTPTRTILVGTGAADIELLFQWATHFNAHAHEFESEGDPSRRRRFNGLLTSTPTRTSP